ncbi:MAG TPA: hypothetical protein VGM49_06485 [Candidatus Limnocylindrales bacterium]|jgi:hypothetical protein
MHRRDIGISIAAGLVLILLGLTNPTGIGDIVIEYVAGPAINFWWIGAAALVASIVLWRQRARPDLARILGFVGVTWLTFLVGAIGFFIFEVATQGFGY